MSINIAINGAAGRMGRRLVALARAETELKITATLDAPTSARLGTDAGELAGCGRFGVSLTDSCDAPFDVLIDFSTPDGAMRSLDLCLERNKPLITGTTALTNEQMQRLDQAAESIALLHSPNMSIGVNVMLRTVQQLTNTLGSEYDIEIVESHHRYKVDAPSGTANYLLAAIRQARGMAAGSDEAVIHGRNGMIGTRPMGEIGVHAIRMGDVVGRHEVHFGTIGETLTLSHVATSRDTFVHGALRAARWIAPRPPGRYSMQEVLFGNE